MMAGDNLRNPFGPKVIGSLWLLHIGSLWLLHDRMHSCLPVKILPTAVVKMVHKSQINETYSLMNFPL
jgi:hypothetical protein